MSRAHTGMSRSLAARAVQQHDKKKRASSNQKEYLIRILNAANFKSFPACCRPDGFSIFFAATAKRPCISMQALVCFQNLSPCSCMLWQYAAGQPAVCVYQWYQLQSSVLSCTVSKMCVLLPLWIIIPCVHIFFAFWQHEALSSICL